jgi:hypothetical protein
MAVNGGFSIATFDKAGGFFTSLPWWYNGGVLWLYHGLKKGY